MSNKPPFSANGNGPVEAALADYLARVDRGEEVDLPALVSAYPGCSEEDLRTFIAQERNVCGAIAAGLLVETPASIAGRRLGDFQMLRILGRGGMGVVYEAEQISLRRKVTVKLLPSALCTDPRHRTRFQNEARILAQLAHPHIVNVLAVGEEAETYYFAMQYVEGMTADHLIRCWGNEKRPHDAETARRGLSDDTETESTCDSANSHLLTAPPPWVASYAERSERYRLCARIVAEVADGLAHAHACGVLHRDVKPSNILLDQSGTSRLTDFGLARMYGDATLTATGAFLGTLRYASPEQLGGSRAAADERSDIYSLGVTLWELVTGKQLFHAENHNSVIGLVLSSEAPRPSSFAAKLPRDLETVIIRAMAKEPRDRYLSAQAMADDLRRFLDGRPIQAKPVTLGERAFRWANRNRVLATTAVSSLVVLSIVALVASGLVLRANSHATTALRKTRDLLYTADMALAGAAWHENQPDQVRTILDRYAKPNTRVDEVSVEDPRGFEWYFLDRQVRPQSELLFQNDKMLYLIEFTPDGKEFFTAGEDSIVRWHDAASGRVVRSLDTQQREINCVSYNPNGTAFATAGDDGTIKVWNASDRTLQQSIKADDHKCFFAKFIDNENVFTGGDFGYQRIFNTVSGKLVREYISLNATAPGVTTALSMHACLSRSKDRVWVQVDSSKPSYQGVYEWILSTGKSRRVHKETVISFQADRSEQYLFVKAAGGYMRILNAKSGDEKWSTQLDFGLDQALALSADESRLAIGDRTGQVYLWNLDLQNPKAIVTSEAPQKISIHNRTVFGILFTSDRDSLLTVGGDGAVRRTRVGTRKEPFRELPGLTNHPCISIPRSDYVLVFGNAPLSMLEPTAGKVIRKFSSTHYSVAAVSSDGTLVAAASTNELGVWNLASGKRILRVDQQRNSARRLDFSSNNSLLAVLSTDATERRVDVLEIATGKSKQYTAPEIWSTEICFCSNDGLIVRGSDPYQLTCWSIPDGQIRWRTFFTDERIHAIAPSPDRTLLLANVRTRDLRLIDCATGAIRFEASNDYNPGAFAFLRDGRSFIVGNFRGGQLSIWHTATGRRLFDLANLETSITSIQCTDSGFLAATNRVKDGRTELVWYEF